MRRICKRSGVRRYTYHTIRHFVASYLYDKEKRTLPEISKLLRHTNYQTTERYLQLVDPNLRETMRLLEGFTIPLDEKDLTSHPSLALKPARKSRGKN